MVVNGLKDGLYFREFIDPELFRWGDGSDGTGGTDVPAGGAGQLAPAGAVGEVQHRCPQVFNAAEKARRDNNIGRAYPHALAAFDASVQKVAFRQ